jgi:glycosyltransferase involved in cell wall biosynthesis
MAFAKPVLCSKLAGSMEMVTNGENGFTFDPARDKPEELMEIIKRFIDDPYLIQRMGEKSKIYASSHTPETVANYMKYIIEFVLGWRDGKSKVFSEYQQE